MPVARHRVRPVFGPRLRLTLLLIGAACLLVGPTPAARALGHRLASSDSVARRSHGGQALAGAPAPTGSKTPAATGPAQPAPPPATGPSQPTATGPAGPAGAAGAKPSASAGPGNTVAGAARRTGTDGVALTFDDGPDPVQTPLILDLLKENGVTATFCLVGFRARDHADLVKRIADEGHTLCNHSWQHLTDLAKRPADYIRWDLESTNAAIRAAVPDARITYFRAPGGNFTPDLVATAAAMGMASIYWQVDPRDWEHKHGETDPAHTARVIAQIQHDTKPGSIVLSHDNKQPCTIEAYRTLLPWLKERFTLVPL